MELEDLGIAHVLPGGMPKSSDYVCYSQTKMNVWSIFKNVPTAVSEIPNPR